MVRPASAILGLVGVAVGSVAAWTAYQNRTTQRVPYDVIDQFDGVEIRRYHAGAIVETVAPTEGAAFGRLFRYISEPNRTTAKIPMTVPVETDGGGTETTGGGDGVRMAFYLPAEYDAATAPEPTDPTVRVAAVPPRTLAVRRFTWRATDRRVARETGRLLSALDAAAGMTPVADPVLLRYDAPGAPPFLRRNEVAVELDVDRASGSSAATRVRRRASEPLS